MTCMDDPGSFETLFTVMRTREDADLPLQEFVTSLELLTHLLHTLLPLVRYLA